MDKSIHTLYEGFKKIEWSQVPYSDLTERREYYNLFHYAGDGLYMFKNKLTEHIFFGTGSSPKEALKNYYEGKRNES